MFKKILASLLCLGLLMTLALPAQAKKKDPDPAPQVTAPVIRELSITSMEEFLTFAENCRLDSYSRDLKVTLETDLNFSGTLFQPIPSFSGTFDGGGHSISDLSLIGDGSHQGLFRYLTETAVVTNLNVRGSIAPGGSRCAIGGIAGENRGQIQNCTFTGSVSGTDSVGGIAGINTLTGIIENCRVSGQLHASHFAGGIAGENAGVIRDCENRSAVNTTPQQNEVELSDITLNNITNSETVNTVTDIGGIAGISTGVIRGCVNRGDVGYRQMGFNIGGIAGTQSGYIVSCENHGTVQGRKEVGGIVGQLEPSTLVNYEVDTLQILQEQLDSMSSTVKRTAANARENAEGITFQLDLLQDLTEDARDAAEMLLRSEGDPDTILAAQNNLSYALGSMPGTVRSLAASADNTVSGISKDVNTISRQIDAMEDTIASASDTVGVTINDISDLDTPTDLSGKVAACVNRGAVYADMSAGGIAGAMAMESDMDVMEDWAESGQRSLNADYTVRAVVMDCENTALVSVHKQQAGGIVGWQSLGLVKNCTNTGAVEAEGGSYAGGISGISTGYIRSNRAKCVITADTYLGGIAGSGTILSDNISMVRLLGAKECYGAILGDSQEPQTEVEGPAITGNFYPLLGKDMGAIDGISYDTLAQSKPLSDFLEDATTPEAFKTVTVSFRFENGQVITVDLTPGEGLPAARIPAIPRKDGFTASWPGLEDADLDNVIFDMTFEASYTPYTTTLQSDLTVTEGIPVVLAEGSFPEGSVLTAAETEEADFGAAWEIAIPQGTEKLRLRLPEDMDGAHVKLLVEENGTWAELPFTLDGSYLVFSAEAGTVTCGVSQTKGMNPLLLAIPAALILIAFPFIIKHRKKQKT